MGGYYACDDCCHMRDLDEYGDAEYRALVEVANLLHTRNLNPNPNCLEVRRMVRSVDPYHLMFGTIACGEPWYWSEEGAGLGMDVMMKAGHLSPSLRSAVNTARRAEFRCPWLGRGVTGARWAQGRPTRLNTESSR